MKLSVVIPAHNEAENLRMLVSDICKTLNKGRYDYEILIIDDNSIDNTKAVIKDISKLNKKVKHILRNDGVKGVGLTLKRGFNEATGDVIITMDGDCSHDPKEIPKMIKKLREGYDLVLGSRRVKGGSANFPLFRRIMSGGYCFIAKHVLNIPINDLTTGYRCFKKSVLNKIKLEKDEFEIHPEINFKIHSAGYKIKEIPIHYSKRAKGSSKLKYLTQGPKYLKVIFEARLKDLKI